MINIKRTLFVSIIVAATSLMPSASVAAPDQGEMMYERYYYSDANHSEEVGYERDTCTANGVGTSATQGISTPYFYQNPIAICFEGQLYPY
jgi:hypothetical protein